MLQLKNPSQTRILFYVALAAVQIIQALFTDLLEDEAYYWMYSRQPAWGYFDHPPMVAFFIMVGYSVLKNELGVRLMSIAAGLITIRLWEEIIQPKNLKLFYGLVASVAIVQVMGFVAVPDVPLLLFTSLFFLLFKKFTEKPGAIISIGMGLTIAAMILSKYHGFIIVGLVVLCNLQLLRNRFFWLTAIISIVGLLPHVLWQIEADFPSLKYHLNERNDRPYEWNFTGYYIIFQLFVLGPLTGIFLFITGSRFNPSTNFERTLKFTFWGAYVFFLIMSFRSWIEGHWTLFAVIPGIYLAYDVFQKNEKLKVIFFKTVPVSLVLIAVARLLVMVDFFPSIPALAQFHDKKPWAKAVYEAIGDYPVGFTNSYQRASLYTFYTPGEGFSINDRHKRKNQFNIWRSEEIFRGQRLAVSTQTQMVPTFDVAGVDKFNRYAWIENYQQYPNLKVETNNLPEIVKRGQEISIDVIISNLLNTEVDLGANPDMPVQLVCMLRDEYFIKNEIVLQQLNRESLNKPLRIALQLPDIETGYIAFGIKVGWLGSTINSDWYQMKVIQ